MGYILAEILACLLLTGLVGGILGWLLRGGDKEKIKELQAEIDLCEDRCKKKIEEISNNYEHKIKTDHDLWQSKLKTIETEYGEKLNITPVTISNENSSKISEDTSSKLTLLDESDTKSHFVLDDEFLKECYDLEEVPGIGTGFAVRLKKRGIFNSCYLANRFANDNSATKKMAKKLDIDFDTLKGWAVMSELMKQEGINGDFAEILQAVGINSKSELARSDAHHLYTKIKDYIDKYPRPTNLANPDINLVKNWIAQAKG